MKLSTQTRRCASHTRLSTLTGLVQTTLRRLTARRSEIVVSYWIGPEKRRYRNVAKCTSIVKLNRLATQSAIPQFPHNWTDRFECLGGFLCRIQIYTDAFAWCILVER